MPKKPGFHPPQQHSSPEGKTSKLSVLPFTEKSPCPLTHSPSTDEQLHHMHVSLQDEMEKPAAKATAATADFSHWFKKKKKKKGSEGKGRGEDKLFRLSYLYYRRPQSALLQTDTVPI